MDVESLPTERFLERLRASRLLAEDEVARVEQMAANCTSGLTLAKAVIENKMLTRFQAEMILRGRTDGFRLGQYRILERIGRGGMGRVFKAEHETMKRIVALKVLAPDLVKTERARRMFEREVRAVARLHHPNIVTAYDANQSGDRHYLVMEYVDGPNLFDLVKETGPLPVGQACEFVRQAAVGLHYAFEAGLVHRDIKPGNLLVQRSGERGWLLKISDFGLARLHNAHNRDTSLPSDAQSSDNQVMGTPDFIAPEQAKNPKQTDIRSDIYSLGCTLFFLLTAQVPFPGRSVLEKIIRHAKELPPPLHELRADVPVELTEIVTRMLAKLPDHRFQTPAEVVAALTPFCDLSSSSLPMVDMSSPAIAPNSSPWASIFEESDSGDVVGQTSGTIIDTPSSRRISARAGGRSRRQWLKPSDWWVWLAIGAAGMISLIFAIVLWRFFLR